MSAHLLLNMAAVFPSVSELNSRELHRATVDARSSIAWCREHGLLARELVCSLWWGDD